MSKLEKRWSEYQPPPKDEKKEEIQKPKLLEHKNMKSKKRDDDKDNQEDDDDPGSVGSGSDKKPRKTPPKFKDLKAHSKGPPVDKDGHIIPPPPIIGPDGKEVARPRDSKGNPLPIYVTPEGKPVFDKDGQPIALKFDKDGNPVLLDLSTRMSIPGGKEELPPASTETSGPRRKISEPPITFKEKKLKVPACWPVWFGLVDIVISLILAGFVLKVLVPLREKANNDDEEVVNNMNRLTATLVVLLLGAVFAGLPIYGAKKDKGGAIIAWCLLCAVSLAIQVYICSETKFSDLVTVLPMSYFLVRFIVSICTCIPSIVSEEPNTPNPRRQSVPVGAQYYPGFNPSVQQPQNQQVLAQQQQQPQQVLFQQQPQTQQVLVQQQQPVYIYSPSMAALPYYSSYGYPGYGYGYPGFPSYGYGYSGGMGFYGGFGHHHHCGTWDWW